MIPKPVNTKPTSSNLMLTKSIYGLETDPKKTPFGFINGQVRGDGIINNAGWFNLAGEKIGHGDISMIDMSKIAIGLNDKECFIILTEFDTVWGMPKEMNGNEPGKEYVLRHCAWSISRGSILKVRDTTTATKTETAILDGVQYTKVSRNAFEKVVATLFYSAKQSVKHAIPPDTKTDGMDALIKSNLQQLQKLTLKAQPAATTVGLPHLPATQAPATAPKATATPKAIAPHAAPPVKVKRITP